MAGQRDRNGWLEPTERVDGDRHGRAASLELLVLADGDMRALSLPPNATWVVGRSPDADVVIPQTSVSRRHARLHIKGARVDVEDLESVNGVVLDGERLETGATGALSIGRVAEIGTVLLLVRPARSSVEPPPDDAPFVGESIQPVYETLRRIAPARINVLIRGETGAGKEVIATALHELSPRAGRPMLPLNCAAIPDNLVESELFGHEKGAFTGATQAKAGLLERANGGTLFLDEVGELPLAMQAKLLRVLEDHDFSRVGGTRTLDADVRFVAATNRDLQAAVESGDFRSDLLYRLDGVTVDVPPLRSRRDEISPLARRFVAHAAHEMGMSTVPELADETLATLERHDWPGNIRELRNVMQRTVLLARARRIEPEHLPESVHQGHAAAAPAPAAGEAPRRSDPDPAPRPEGLRSELEEVERRRIIEALDACGGNQTRAAQTLGMSRRALIRRIEAYAIPRPRKGK